MANLANTSQILFNRKKKKKVGEVGCPKNLHLIPLHTDMHQTFLFNMLLKCSISSTFFELQNLHIVITCDMEKVTGLSDLLEVHLEYVRFDFDYHISDV